MSGVVSVISEVFPALLTIDAGTLTEQGDLTFRTHEGAGDAKEESVWTGKRANGILTLRREIETSPIVVQSFTLERIDEHPATRARL